MKKITILGGGMGSLSAAYWLTNNPGWEREYTITLYQLGWRLGGKAASGRNPQAWQRTEEHGYHMLFGFYENTFATMRGCYEALGRGPDSPLSEFLAIDPKDEERYPHRYAVKRNNLLFLAEELNGKHEVLTFDFPANTRVPGDGAVRDSWTTLEDLVRWFRRIAADPQWAPPRHGQERRPFGSTWRSALGQLTPELADDIRAAAGDGLATVEGPLDLALKLAGSLGTAGLGRRISRAITGLLTLYLRGLWQIVKADIRTDWQAYRAWILQDFVGTNLIGLLADEILVRGYDSINDINYCDWLLRHAAVPEGTRLTAGSVLGQFAYDACFAFEGGDALSPRRPDKPLRGAADMEAGTMLRGGIRLFCDYKGAVDWLFQAGGGDALVVPMYELLVRRGVRFKFFHKVLDLGLDATGKAIESIKMERQVTLSVGDYQPLVMVKGMPSWPSEPLYPQIIQGRELQQCKVNLESHWSNWKGEELTLHRGKDFDDVILGIALGALPSITSKLAGANERWRLMLEKLKTTRTFGFQTWLTRSTSELGWHKGPIRSDTGCEPTSMEAEATPVVDVECWPRESVPRNLTYFGGVMKDDPNEPPLPDPAYPPAQDELIAEQAVEFLNRHARIYWPACATDEGFPWDILADPLHAHVRGPARFRSQFWRANIDPSERYVLSVVGSTKYRLTADGSGFVNLYLAGDWIKTGLDCGCMEATVMSGMQASRAICGYPRAVYGEHDSPIGISDGDEDDGTPGAACVAFDAFSKSLSEAERETLHASVPMLIGIVVRADGVFDRLERRAVSRMMDDQVVCCLGDDFRWSHAARREYQALCGNTPRLDDRPNAERLAELRAVLDKMPEDLKRRYNAFVTRSILQAAEASGTWLWFGVMISADERRALRRIATALDLELPHVA